MSRREVPLKEDAAPIVRVIVGWDCPLETFFAQAFADGEDGDDITVVWQGSYPGELPTPRSAVPLIEAYRLVPDGLGRQLETDRVAIIATSRLPSGL